VGRKLDLLLHQASADTLTTAAGPIEELRQQEAAHRQEMLERVAYSWFNRLAALRYLDARLWHLSSARVLMAQTESETQPELLKLLRSGSLPAQLQPHTDEARLQGLLDGRLPTAHAGADPQGEVYRELVIGAAHRRTSCCRICLQGWMLPASCCCRTSCSVMARLPVAAAVRSATVIATMWKSSASCISSISL